MVTDADIKKMKRVFATKEDLEYLSNKFEAKFATKDYLKAIEDKMATKEDLKKYATKDDLINFKDSILSEIIKLREDVTVIISYRDLIENYDKRIGKLETAVYQ